METSASDRRDGGHVIAEYDDSGLLRKYIYGARVDEPVCMLENPASDGIDVADNNAAYYYHFDGLGSVVALSNSNGDSCQSYEYSVYGQVAASDPNFLANPYMFTGRRFDIETGLYYYRARYYNPHIGRFMQTDPVGYSAGMNWYAYCGNNPQNVVDPSGLLARHSFLQPGHPQYQAGKLTLAYWIDGKIDRTTWVFNDLDEFYTWGSQGDILNDIRNQNPAGWEVSGGDTTIFLAIKALEFMYVFSSIEISMIENEGWTIVNNDTRQTLFGNSANGYVENTIYWSPNEENYPTDPERNWNAFPAVAGLAHEMGHALDIVQTGYTTQESAIKRENSARYASYTLVPEYENIWPRPLTGNNDLGWTIKRAWKNYFRSYRR